MRQKSKIKHIEAVYIHIRKTETGGTNKANIHLTYRQPHTIELLPVKDTEQESDRSGSREQGTKIPTFNPNFFPIETSARTDLA